MHNKFKAGFEKTAVTLKHEVRMNDDLKKFISETVDNLSSKINELKNTAHTVNINADDLKKVIKPKIGLKTILGLGGAGFITGLGIGAGMSPFMREKKKVDEGQKMQSPQFGKGDANETIFN